MPEFQVAYFTQAGRGPRHEAVVDGRLSYHPDAIRLLALVRQPESLDLLGIPLPLPRSPGSIEEQLSAVGFDIALRVVVDPFRMSLQSTATPGVLQYYRRADATLVPLPPEHAPAGHRLITERVTAGDETLVLAPGDAYIAVSPGVAGVADSPAIARFLHLRDYFNADKLVEALLAHLSELAGPDGLPEDVTVLVVEAR